MPEIQHPEPPKSATQKKDRSIVLTGVRQNNLKSISVRFPARQLTVVTGLSGSGKSSLVFDTLYAEGQRRYVESLSTYTRQFLDKMPRPDLDTVENIPPAIALEQRNSVLNSRSTVGSQTETNDYLRVLFARIGQVTCRNCGGPVVKHDEAKITERILKWGEKRKIYILAPQDPQSLNTDYLKGLLAEGYGRVYIPTENTHGELTEIESLLSFGLDASKFPQGLFILIDRMKLESFAASLQNTDAVSRLTDSVHQALHKGNGQVFVLDSETSQSLILTQGFSCEVCAEPHTEPEPELFSSNSALGACKTCSGFGFTLDLDEQIVVPDKRKTLAQGAIDPFTKPSAKDWQDDMLRFCERQNIAKNIPYFELSKSDIEKIWNGAKTDRFYKGIRGCFEELIRYKYKIHVRVFIRRYQTQNICPECHGSRLTGEALRVWVGEKNFPQVLDLPVENLLVWISELTLSPTQQKIAGDLFAQVQKRISLLEAVGVGYLTLARLTKTLSGGEFQRINLATQLGNGLCGTLYVLDEPSIGLHASDTHRMIAVLKKLRDQGNTVVVVEHDLDVIAASDHIIEIGPFAGRGGGNVVAQAPIAEFRKSKALTAQYLNGTKKVERSHPKRATPHKWLKIKGCREHNLKNINVDFPLERFCVITGVSGSGKSTLIHKTLSQALFKHFDGTKDPVGTFDRLYGLEQVAGVVLLDQSPIGKTSRSNPATYLKAWDEVRKIYARDAISVKRGYSANYFSFNTDGGRCPVCKGEGEVAYDLHFMAELKLPCEACGGKRFRKAILDVIVKGKSISDLLETTIDEAYELFRDNSVLHKKFSLLRSVGLGYLQVGQSATTLSGGESQRLKIAATLDEAKKKNMLYLFDEPTTGLHLQDVQRLFDVLQDLVDAKHSVIVIEHHLDIIAQADWLIELGPFGGERGGHLLYQGPPSEITAIDTPTSRVLATHHTFSSPTLAAEAGGSA